MLAPPLSRIRTVPFHLRLWRIVASALSSNAFYLVYYYMKETMRSLPILACTLECVPSG